MPPKKRFINLFKESFPKLRPYLIGIQILLISVSPLFNPTYRVALAVPLLLTLFYLFFDIYNELVSRLNSIENHLKEPEPPTFGNFIGAETPIKEIIHSHLDANEDVSINILAITAQYSWKFIEDNIESFLERGNQRQKITVNLAITKPEILELWLQKKLMADAVRTLEGIGIFNSDHEEHFSQGRLKLNVYSYDNIPHWHGVLINENVLFLGRTRWRIKGENTELTVGQNIYRKFSKNDRFRGTDRINTFTNWLERYKLRDMELSKELATL